MIRHKIKLVLLPYLKVVAWVLRKIAPSEFSTPYLPVFRWDIDFVDGFKSFIQKNPDAIDNLKLSMDQESAECIDLGLKRLFSYPSKEYAHAYRLDHSAYQNAREKQDWFLLQKNVSALKKRYGNAYLPFSSTEFYYEHGLSFLDDKVKLHLKDGVFFDCGAFDGASSLIMGQYSPKKIIAFEPNENNQKLAQYRLAKADKNLSEKVEFQLMCVGEEDGEVMISSGSCGSSIFVEEGQCVPIIKIDTYVKQNLIHDVKWIKADLEGAALMMVKGAEKTIKRDRPLLTIGVYHSPDEFFCIKKLIESWNLNYHFMMRRCQCDPAMPYNEITLIVVPKDWL